MLKEVSFDEFWEVSQTVGLLDSQIVLARHPNCGSTIKLMNIPTLEVLEFSCDFQILAVAAHSQKSQFVCWQRTGLSIFEVNQDLHVQLLCHQEVDLPIVDETSINLRYVGRRVFLQVASRVVHIFLVVKRPHGLCIFQKFPGFPDGVDLQGEYTQLRVHPVNPDFLACWSSQAIDLMEIRHYSDEFEIKHRRWTLAEVQDINFLECFWVILTKSGLYVTGNSVGAHIPMEGVCLTVCHQKIWVASMDKVFVLEVDLDDLVDKSSPLEEGFANSGMDYRPDIDWLPPIWASLKVVQLLMLDISGISGLFNQGKNVLGQSSSRLLDLDIVSPTQYNPNFLHPRSQEITQVSRDSKESENDVTCVSGFFLEGKVETFPEVVSGPYKDLPCVQASFKSPFSAFDGLLPGNLVIPSEDLFPHWRAFQKRQIHTYLSNLKVGFNTSLLETRLIKEELVRQSAINHYEYLIIKQIEPGTPNLLNGLTLEHLPQLSHEDRKSIDQQLFSADTGTRQHVYDRWEKTSQEIQVFDEKCKEISSRKEEILSLTSFLTGVCRRLDERTNEEKVEASEKELRRHRVQKSSQAYECHKLEMSRIEAKVRKLNQQMGTIKNKSLDNANKFDLYLRKMDGATRQTSIDYFHGFELTDPSLEARILGVYDPVSCTPDCPNDLQKLGIERLRLIAKFEDLQLAWNLEKKRGHLVKSRAISLKADYHSNIMDEPQNADPYFEIYLKDAHIHPSTRDSSEEELEDTEFDEEYHLVYPKFVQESTLLRAQLKETHEGLLSNLRHLRHTKESLEDEVEVLTEENRSTQEWLALAKKKGHKSGFRQDIQDFPCAQSIQKRKVEMARKRLLFIEHANFKQEELDRAKMEKMDRKIREKSKESIKLKKQLDEIRHSLATRQQIQKLPGEQSTSLSDEMVLLRRHRKLKEETAQNAEMLEVLIQQVDEYRESVKFPGLLMVQSLNSPSASGSP